MASEHIQFADCWAGNVAFFEYHFKKYIYGISGIFCSFLIGVNHDYDWHVKDSISALLKSSDNLSFNDVSTSNQKLLYKSQQLVAEMCSHLSSSYLLQVCYLAHHYICAEVQWLFWSQHTTVLACCSYWFYVVPLHLFMLYCTVSKNCARCGFDMVRISEMVFGENHSRKLFAHSHSRACIISVCAVLTVKKDTLKVEYLCYFLKVCCSFF